MRIALSSLLLVAAWYGMAVERSFAAITTYQSGISQVSANGSVQVRNEFTNTNGAASTQAIWPAGTQPVQGRTAARAGSTEIAANARIFSEDFGSGEVFGSTLSQAYYAVRIDALPVTSDMSLDFFLPPSYAEVVQNGETFFNSLDTVFFADLRVCQQETCTELERQFHFQAGATGTFRDMQHNILTEGNSSLDLTTLENPTVTDTTTMVGVPIRTYLVEFPSYTGHLDLGRFVSGTPFTVEYYLQARVSGTTVLNSAIAAINDPFEVDGDPVQQGPPLVLTMTAVPEPGTVLIAFGLVSGLWCLRGQRFSAA